MKTLLFACLLLGLLRPTAQCDLLRRPPSFPTTITVANLAKYPGFKFSYTTDNESEPKDLEPLRETQVVWHQQATIRFFVEESGGERFEWASIKTGFHPKTFAISILDARRDGKKIKVNYKVDPESASEGKPAGKSGSAVFPFALSGFSLGAVVFLVRRKRAASAGG